ncbi:class II glutamine amidotransferase [Arenibacterium sp. CAU 1754]
MCRLYAMRANEPTRVECSLVKSQNALMQQSQGDAENLVHGHGWGVADYKNGAPMVEKQTWAAFHGEHFAKAAARVYAHTVVAHVRRATVGGTSPENTHPFHHGRWIFAHNGTVPNFAEVRDRMMPHIDPLLQNDIKGTTDSEHIFYFLLTIHMANPTMPMREVAGIGLDHIVNWSNEVDPSAKIGLNIIMTDGKDLVGSRMGRTLWQLVRETVDVCPICGKKHVHHEHDQEYRAVEIASEPITDENWQELPDGVVFSVDEDYYLLTEPLAKYQSRTQL